MSEPASVSVRAVTIDRRVGARLLVACCLACCLLISACDARPPATGTAVVQPKGASSSHEELSVKTPAPGKEHWAKILLGGKHAGYRRLVIRPGGQPDTVAYEMTQMLRVTRGKDTIEQTLAQSSLETTQGGWVRGESKLSDGRSENVDKIEVKGKLLDIEQTAGSKTSRQTIPWKGEYIGFFGAEASLRNTPLRPGEHREFTMLFPMFNALGTITITAKDWTEVTLDGAKHKALEVEQVETIQTTSTRSTLWLDEAGEMLASETPTLNMRIERSTQTIAEAIPKGQGFDLLAATLVKLKSPLADSQTQERQRYRVTLKTENPAKVFATLPYQSLTPIDEHSAELTVAKATTVTSASGVAPDRVDLISSPLIDYDSPIIMELAAGVAPGEMDKAALALALEKFTHDYIETKDYAAAFDSASHVAKAKSGDCTEHAVLLTALCRARGIPARCASGLIYIPSQQAFGFHMWTLAFVNGRWLPLDATLGIGGTTIGHLQLADSSLSSGLDADLFLPVMSVLGQMEIEVVEP